MAKFTLHLIFVCLCALSFFLDPERLKFLLEVCKT